MTVDTTSTQYPPVDMPALKLLKPSAKITRVEASEAKTIVTTCTNDCGGRCPLKVFVRNNAITSIEPCDDHKIPPLKACVRGLNYHHRVYAPDRLKYPLIRVGERGSGRFRRISWDKALTIIADEMQRIKNTYGPEAIFECVYSGSILVLLHSTMWGAIYRLLNRFGGRTAFGTMTSGEGASWASRYTYGKTRHGDSSNYSDLINSKLIILWAYNPAENHMGTSTLYWFKKARDTGVKVIYVDPCYTETARFMKAEWIPIRPSTDTAMLIAMAYVLITENLYDTAYVEKYVHGFEQYRDYVIGIADGIPKTPAWASCITGVPAETIALIAREYAAAKPAALIPGYAPGRTANGEQYHRATIALQAMTGNIGVSGGCAQCGGGNSDKTSLRNLMVHELDYKGSKLKFGGKGVEIKTGHWADAVLKGKSGGYPSDIKMIYIVGHNILTSRANTKKGIEAFKKAEFVVCHEQFLTPTARYSDIVLPVNTGFERNDIAWAWIRGNYTIFANKAIEPMWDSKSDLDIIRDLAAKLGIQDFDGKTEDEYLRSFFDAFDLGYSDGGERITYEELKQRGLIRHGEEPFIAFKEQIDDPEHNPFPTPSGKIEIYSRALDETDFDVASFSSVTSSFNEIPRIPTFLECDELPTSPQAKKYPLQLTTPHHSYRIHSQFFNIPKLRKLYKHEVWINPLDAQTRGITDGDTVIIYNDRGAIQLLAKVTDRMMQGVLRCYEGGWYEPDENGIDIGGCVNVLLDDALTSPGASSNCNTCLVDVKKTLERHHSYNEVNSYENRTEASANSVCVSPQHTHYS